MPSSSIKGRGAAFNPANRFEQTRLESLDIEMDEPDAPTIRTSFYRDISKSILSKNDSPDLKFSYSINPYRGCEHGCIYCYARPSHEYLGFSSGIDFESKIMVKLDAPTLLTSAFRKKRWQPQVVLLSGNTDCYQPVEQKLQITRACLNVFLLHRNPVAIITKNALIARDIDILKELASLKLVRVMISMTSLEPELIRKMEPRTATPQRRLDTIELLASHAIPVGIIIAPLIPGLNDEDMPAILREAAARGASFAGLSMIRLPGTVEQLFTDWLTRELPLRSSKIIARIRDIRKGKLNDTRWDKRLAGEGESAATIRKMFDVSCRKYHLNEERIELTASLFIREPGGEPTLFG
jgi:DNA repair photolyase